MDKNQYKKELEEIKLSYINNEKDLMEKYAMKNNPYNIGDIIQDHCNILKIEEIKWRRASLGEELPSCVYYGVELSKKLDPKKKQINTEMHQCNVIAKLK